MLESKMKVKAPEGDFSGYIGVHGHNAPYLILDDLIDTSCFEELHEEICLGLTSVDYSYIGGNHKSTNIVPPEFADDEFKDFGYVIANFTDQEFETFIRLADGRVNIDMANWRNYTFGEDGQIELSWRQLQYLKIKYGVYFPWKGFVEFLPGDTNWNTKHLVDAEFPDYIQYNFPRTCAYLRTLPFKSLGRCNIMGLEANDHGTIHRDNFEMLHDPPINDFITICPPGNKDLFLYNSERREKLFVPKCKAYTFNDMNYHGVEAAPHYRYSIRVDGIFTDEFREQIRA